MTRGKHAKSTARRRAQALAATLTAAQGELVEELAGLAKAQEAVDQLHQARKELALLVAEVRGSVQPEIDRLECEIAILTAVVTEVERLRSRIDQLYKRTAKACILRLGGGKDGVDRFAELTLGH